MDSKEYETAGGIPYSPEEKRCAHFFNRAQAFKTDQDEEKFRLYYTKFRNAALDAVIAGQGNFALGAMLYQAGEHEAVLELLEHKKNSLTSDLLPILAASIHFARKEPHKALAVSRLIQNEEQRRLRQKTAALWQDLHKPLDAEPRVHLLILTYNREEYVTEALRQLAATDYTNYAVFIADNGSSDATLEKVREAADFFPVPVEIAPLPTNIGRPAGHNWLLTAFDHSNAEYIAIGDDDLVRVPADWLRRMLQTAKAIPGCGCVGGKALTPGWPVSIHGGIRNFTQFGPDIVDLTNGSEQDDLGQFDYLDIVDHVIGCLHIFDRAVLDRTGLFDIRFSPCQMVDIEHHLRMRLAGETIVFNGLISFEHLRSMGASSRTDKALLGNSLGNMLKILYKYDHESTQQGILNAHAARHAWLMD